jgi:YVTN family beta-propeller protein
MHQRLLVRFALFTVAVLGGGACILHAQTTPATSLLVLAKRDSSLAIVDPTSLKVVAKVPAGPDPHEVVASLDGKFAFISNYGFGTYNTLSVVDLVAQKALPPIDLGALRGPHGLAFAAGRVYFTAEVNKVIGRYDPATGKIDWILGTGQNRTHMILVSKDLDHIFTSNTVSASVNIIEKGAGGFGPPGPNGPGGPPAGPPRAPPNGPGGGGIPMGAGRQDWNETVVAVGRGSEGFDVSPDGKELWVANAQDGTISIIDLASKKVTQTLDANVRGANRLKFTPDGKFVFVSCLGGENLVVLDASSRADFKRIKLGRGAAGILMQPDGSRAYVACSPDDYVAVIDLRNLQIIGRIEAGREPDGLAWATQQ